MCRGPSCGDKGFTLTEMMIVVVLLSILAAIALVGFRKYIARARAGEAIGMLAEIAAKEQTYYMEFGTYTSLRASGATQDEAVTAFYPQDPTAAAFESSRQSFTLPAATSWPVGWQNVGLRPKAQELYCTYLANVGVSGTTAPGGYGLSMLGATALTAPWYYGLAACNLSGGQAANLAAVTVMGLTSISPSLRAFNDGL